MAQLNEMQKVIIHDLKERGLPDDCIIGIIASLEQETEQENMIYFLAENKRATQSDILYTTAKILEKKKDETLVYNDTMGNQLNLLITKNKDGYLLKGQFQYKKDNINFEHNLSYEESKVVINKLKSILNGKSEEVEILGTGDDKLSLCVTPLYLVDTEYYHADYFCMMSYFNNNLQEKEYEIYLLKVQLQEIVDKFE